MRFVRITLFLLTGVVLLGLGVLYYQGKQQPRTNSAYVSLGSSFAAGLGLGPRQSDSPLVCQRSVNGYPQQLARLSGLDSTDMSCSGATVVHVLHGGQVFLGSQVEAIGPDTQLVTLTAGGNDVGYVGDLTMMAYRHRGGFPGFMAGLLWDGAKPIAERPFGRLRANLIAALREIRRRAPQAQIVVATYPAILPDAGTCPNLGITAKQATLMRSVERRLAEVTRAAASTAGATVVDIATLSRGHDACSAEPWVNGASLAHGAPFHPTLTGAKAVAHQVESATRIKS